MPFTSTSSLASGVTHEHLLHLLIGAVLALAASHLFGRGAGTAPAAATPSAGEMGPGAGGWSYGKVTPSLVAQIHAACADDDQVHVAGESAESDREMIKHSRDMSFHKRSPPQVVVYPESPEEVRAVVKAAYDANVPVVPRGAGSGLEGGAIPCVPPPPRTPHSARHRASACWSQRDQNVPAD